MTLSVTLPLLFSTIFAQLLLLHPHYASSSFSSIFRPALVPVVLFCTFSVIAHDPIEPKADWGWTNVPFTMIPLYYAMRSIEYGLAKESYRFIGFDTENPSSKLNVSHAATEDSSSLADRVTWALSLLLNARGIGWNWGPIAEKLPEPFARRGQTKKFIKGLLFDMSFNHFASQLSSTYCIYAASHRVRNLPFLPVFDSDFKWDHVPLSSALATYSLGVFFWTSFTFSYEIYVLHVFVINLILRYVPLIPSWLRPDPLDYEAWRPMFGPRPYLATSLGQFWSQKWHLVLRRPFNVCGVWPTRKILDPIFGKRFGRCAGIFAAFIISGLVHEWGVIRSAPDDFIAIPYSVTIFFLLHGLLVILEYAFMKTTGIKVKGIGGWLWTTTVMICLGHLLAEPWLELISNAELFHMREWTWPVFFFPYASTTPRVVLL